MGVDLSHVLACFLPSNDFENDVASYQTRTPWIGSEAYLNVIYRPAPPRTLSEVGMTLQFPDSLFEFLARYNGAKLFSGALNLYGVVEKGRLVNRRDSFSLPPFDIQDANESWRTDPERFLVVAGYPYDGSRICIDRSSGRVHLFRKSGDGVDVSWDHFESWLLEEVTRLCLLFDHEGKRLWPESETVPDSIRRLS